MSVDCCYTSLLEVNAGFEAWTAGPCLPEQTEALEMRPLTTYYCREMPGMNQ